jgi:hypothetical protein
MIKGSTGFKPVKLTNPMQEKLNIAVFVDYDNIEIGVKSTLRREFDVSLPLDALKERGDLVAKFAYANWGRQEGAARSRWPKTPCRWCSDCRRRAATRTAATSISRWTRWRWRSPIRT